MTSRSTKGRTFPPEPLTRTEVLALIEAQGARSPTGIRNRALIWTLYRGGLRITEALTLRVKDLDPPKLRVLHGKGEKPRTVALPPDAWAAMDLWLERRRGLSVSRGSPVFCTLQGGQLDHSYICQMLRRSAQRSGIEKRIHAHGFRHTFASELVEEGHPLPLVQQALGHSNLETTARYVSRIGAEPRLVEALTNRPALQAP